MYIALKEVTETEYWINLLTKTQYLTVEESGSILNDCMEVKKIIHAIVKTSKESLK